MNETTPEQFKKLATAGDKSHSLMKTVTYFLNWSAINMNSIDVEECTSIFEDFVKSNQHIIQKINKVMYSSSSTNNNNN
jgi:hypothetical protein